MMNLWLQPRQTWNLIRKRLKGNKLGKTLVLQEASKSGISHPLEASLEESEIWYKLCGDEVVDLQPYAKILRQGLFY